MNRVVALAFTLALVGCNRSCSNSHASEASTGDNIDVGAPPRIAAPAFRDQPGASGFGLPAGCAFDGPVRVATLAAGKNQLLAIGSGLDLLALASAPDDGGNLATHAGLVELASSRVADAPWAELDAPPLFEHASSGFVAAWSVATAAAASRAIFWRAGGKAERLLEGDGLSVVDLFCRGGACATLTSLARAAAAPGATLVFGAASEAVSAYQRIDFEPGGDDAWRPLSIATFDGKDAGFVALASKMHTALMSFAGKRAELKARLDTPDGAYAAAGAKTPFLVAPGAPVDRPCGKEEFPLHVFGPDEKPHEIRTPAAPENLSVRALGTGALIAWVAPVSCQYQDRRVVYAAVVAADGSVATSPMAIGDARAFALASDGNRFSLFLMRPSELVWIRARCD